MLTKILSTNGCPDRPMSGGGFWATADGGALSNR